MELEASPYRRVPKGRGALRSEMCAGVRREEQVGRVLAAPKP